MAFGSLIAAHCFFLSDHGVANGPPVLNLRLYLGAGHGDPFKAEVLSGEEVTHWLTESGGPTGKAEPPR